MEFKNFIKNRSGNRIPSKRTSEDSLVSLFKDYFKNDQSSSFIYLLTLTPNI